MAKRALTCFTQRAFQVTHNFTTMPDAMGSKPSSASTPVATPDCKPRYATWRAFLAHHLSKDPEVRALPNSQRMKKVSEMWREYKSS